MEKDVPYIVYESEAAKHERTVKRLIIALVVAIALLFASNMIWLAFFNSFDMETITATQDATDGGNANFIGESGSISNGESGN